MRAPLPVEPSPQPARRPARGVQLMFAPDVPLDEVVGTLELSLFAVRSLHGQDVVAVDAAWGVDADRRTVTIDTGSTAGRSLALVFLGFVRREFGDAAVRVFRTKGGVA